MTHLQDQTDELELLESMFSSPGEFEIEDRSSHEQAAAYLQHLTPDPPKTLSCVLHIPVNAHQDSDDEDIDDDDESVSRSVLPAAHTINISLRLLASYPDCLPEVYVYAEDLKRRSQDDLNSNLHTFMKTLPLGEACLLPIVEWIRDNAATFFPVPCYPDPKLDPESIDDKNPDSHFCRMWLYMHHIYSQTKRRNILALADELELSGFCLPGKPGVVCIEGTVRKTNEFYSVLRRWNWKSIACRRREVEPSAEVGSLRRVEGFRELSFEVRGTRHHSHMDMGQFLTFLKQHNLEYIFKDLFGVEAHSTDS